MFSSSWVRYVLVALAGLTAAAAGFLLFRTPLQRQVSQQIAAGTAQNSFGRSKLNLLLLGYQDDEATTDTVVLAHLDVDRQTATLVSIPRDTWVPVPGAGMQKINAAYAYGGAKSTAKVVSALLGGIPIDATIALQPEGASQIVDAIGGLNVDVDESMDYDDNNGALHIHLKKGEQYLTGSQVVGYIRFRHDATGDFGRVKRQQQILKNMMDQLSQPQNWAKLPRIMQFARKDMSTSLSDQQLLALLEIYRNVPDDNVRTFTLPSKVGWVGDASVVFADRRWAKLVGDLLFRGVDPPQDEVLVANASGNADVDKTVIGALRGAGWNVPTFVDQPVRSTSYVVGETPAAQLLSKTFAAGLRAGNKTTLVLGSDLAPDTE
ncbi:MAG: LCP family protein [Candidatus Eremiobacteraeota bacterium]|nr:LCP family protein [Candidatus Eremiobacteraeota bacterium]